MGEDTGRIFDSMPVGVKLSARDAAPAASESLVWPAASEATPDKLVWGAPAGAARTPGVMPFTGNLPHDRFARACWNIGMSGSSDLHHMLCEAAQRLELLLADAKAGKAREAPQDLRPHYQEVFAQEAARRKQAEYEAQARYRTADEELRAKLRQGFVVMP